MMATVRVIVSFTNADEFPDTGEFIKHSRGNRFGKIAEIDASRLLSSASGPRLTLSDQIERMAREIIDPAVKWLEEEVAGARKD